MSMLEELYNGNICPADRYIKKGSEYYEISRFLAKAEEDFLEGFRIGAQIMLEILTEPDKQLISI